MCKQYFTLSQLRKHVGDGCPKDGASASDISTHPIDSLEDVNSPLESPEHQNIILDEDVPVLETLEVKSDEIEASSK